MPCKKKLDSFGAICLVVGSILGSGIFITPPILASFSSSWIIIAGLWIVGGLMCAIGASIYGKLGLLFPEGGGQYIYLRESLGNSYSRFYGWMSFFVICPTMLASSALFFGWQWSTILHLSPAMIKVFAVLAVFAFTLLSTRGIHLIGEVQKLLVLLHVVLFIGVIGMSMFMLSGGQFSSYEALPHFGDLSLSKGILALAAILWSFEGFNTITFITNEIESGEKNVRKVALMGCTVVFVAYALFNLSIFKNIPSHELSSQSNVAASLAALLFGSKGSAVVFGLTILGIATVLHSSMLIGPRIMAAMGKEGRLKSKLGSLDPSYNSPNRALWIQCVLVTFCILVGHFEALLTCFIVANWLFYGLTGFGYLKLRLSSASKPSFLEIGATGLFLLMVVLLLGSQFLENPKLATAGVLFCILGVQDYSAWSFSRTKSVIAATNRRVAVTLTRIAGGSSS